MPERALVSRKKVKKRRNVNWVRDRIAYERCVWRVKLGCGGGWGAKYECHAAVSAALPFVGVMIYEVTTICHEVSLSCASGKVGPAPTPQCRYTGVQYVAAKLIVIDT